MALVSGTNRGIGAAVAARLDDLGATVYAGAGDPTAVDAADLRAVGLDVTDDDSVAAALARVTAEAGRLDVLVNDAGVDGPGEALHEAAVSDLDRSFATNLRGPTVLTRAALPLLLSTPAPRVTNVSPGMGALGEPMSGGHPTYRVSKTAFNGLTEYLDAGYGDDGLLANAARPGWVATDMGGAGAPRSVAEGADTPVWLATFGPGHRVAGSGATAPTARGRE